MVRLLTGILNSHVKFSYKNKNTKWYLILVLRTCTFPPSMGKARNISFLKKIGFRIMQLREQRGITQEAFLYDTGINIGRIERAERDFSMTTLFNICKHLKISPQEFFSEVK